MDTEMHCPGCGAQTAAQDEKLCHTCGTELELVKTDLYGTGGRYTLLVRKSNAIWEEVTAVNPALIVVGTILLQVLSITLLVVAVVGVVVRKELSVSTAYLALMGAALFVVWLLAARRAKGLLSRMKD